MKQPCFDETISVSKQWFPNKGPKRLHRKVDSDILKQSMTAKPTFETRMVTSPIETHHETTRTQVAKTPGGGRCAGRGVTLATRRGRRSAGRVQLGSPAWPATRI